MSESNKFCIICGKHLSESHGDDICSENCSDNFNDFKKNPNLISINGFCNLCGKFHELKKNSAHGVILHRHNKCYSAGSYYSKSSLQIEKEREEKRRDLLFTNTKVYDDFSQSLICPFCNTYSVNYSDKWLCSKCNRNVVMKNSNSNNPIGLIDTAIIPLDFNLTKYDKFDIYRHYGIEALVELTGESKYEIIDFIRLYRIEEEELKRKEEEKLRRKEEEKLRRKEKRKILLLSNKKVYDDFSQSLICPFCNTYSVNYSDKWLCNECDRNIVMKNRNSNHPFELIDTGIAPLELDFTKKDKYDIYRHHGIEALVKLTGESQHEIRDFIRLYKIEEEELKRKEEGKEELRRKLKEEEKLRRKLEEEEELRRIEERGNMLLSNKKVYDSDSNLLFCPHCNNYSVEYSNKTNKWSCNKCNKLILMQNSRSPYPFEFGRYSSLEFNFTNEDKYKIYKFYGIESLEKLTGDSQNEIKEVIGSYFEKECTSIGDNCLYYGHFKEADAAKQIESIDNLFKKSKQKCNSLRNEIYSFLDSIEDVQLYLNEDQQKLLGTEYVSIKQTIEALYEQIEDYLIAVANTDIKKGEKVFLLENGDNLLADIVGETFDGFCWNYAKKDDFVGICTVPSYALNQTRQTFKDFKIIFEELNDITSFKKKVHELNLSFLERETISLIIRNDGILQSSLRKQLGIDSKKCSRLVKNLMHENLIHRIPELHSGRNTYRILIKKCID